MTVGSRFPSYTNDGTRKNALLEKTSFGGTSACVWVEIYFDDTESLILINEIMITVRYRDSVIEQIIVFFFGSIGERLIFIDDNARLYRD